MRRLILHATVPLVVASSSALSQLPKLTPLARIGCESCSGDSLFTGIHAVSVASDGRIVVADKTAPRIRIFDRMGKLAQSFGRSGNGPGEFQLPVAVWLSQASIEIVDMTLRRLSRFSAAGEHIASIPLGGFANMGAASPAGQHALVSITAPRAPVLSILRATGNTTDEVARVGDADFPSRPAGNPETLSLAVAPDGSFAVGDGRGAYVIRLYRSNGSFVREIRRDIAKTLRTDEEMRAEGEKRNSRLAAMQTKLGAESRSGGAVVLPPIPRERNHFDTFALRYDEAGRLWVRVERAPVGKSMFDVFDASGRYVGEIIVSAHVRDFALGAAMLAGVVLDDSGVERVQIWAVSLQ